MMSIFARTFSARTIKSCLRQPQQNYRIQSALARYSTIPRFGNLESEDGHSQIPFGKRGIYALIALGGLGFAFAEEYQVYCAEKKEDKDKLM